MFEGRIVLLDQQLTLADLLVCRYSQDGMEWLEVPATPWHPMHAGSAFVFQAKGGGNGKDEESNALWLATGNSISYQHVIVNGKEEEVASWNFPEMWVLHRCDAGGCLPTASAL